MIDGIAKALLPRIDRLLEFDARLREMLKGTNYLINPEADVGESHAVAAGYD